MQAAGFRLARHAARPRREPLVRWNPIPGGRLARQRRVGHIQVSRRFAPVTAPGDTPAGKRDHAVTWVTAVV